MTIKLFPARLAARRTLPYTRGVRLQPRLLSSYRLRLCSVRAEGIAAGGLAPTAAGLAGVTARPGGSCEGRD